MPVVFRWKGYRFHFYANEGSPRESAHIHVAKDNADAKFWLWPDVAVAYNKGYDGRQLAELRRVVEQRRGEIDEAWNEFFD